MRKLTSPWRHGADAACGRPCLEGRCDDLELGDFDAARRDQEFLAGREDRLQWAGTLVPDRLRSEMRPLCVPSRALLAATFTS
jgi:hypothetical protein